MAETKGGRKERDKRYDATISGRYRSLKSSAKSRRLKNLISKDEYQSIMEDASCYYCEKKIDLSKGKGHCLDRINSNKGYYLNNVVPCCQECNSIKLHGLSFEEGIFVIRALKEFRKKLIKT